MRPRLNRRTARIALNLPIPATRCATAAPSTQIKSSGCSPRGSGKRIRVVNHVVSPSLTLRGGGRGAGLEWRAGFAVREQIVALPPEDCVSIALKRRLTTEYSPSHPLSADAPLSEKTFATVSAVRSLRKVARHRCRKKHFLLPPTPTPKPVLDPTRDCPNPRHCLQYAASTDPRPAFANRDKSENISANHPWL